MSIILSEWMSGHIFNIWLIIHQINKQTYILIETVIKMRMHANKTNFEKEYYWYTNRLLLNLIIIEIGVGQSNEEAVKYF